jgi:hypothetical protein
LGTVPVFVRPVLLCLNIDQNFTVGSEVDIGTSIVDGADPAFLFAADAGAIGMQLNPAVPTPLVLNASTGIPGAIDPAKWAIKVYFQ